MNAPTLEKMSLSSFSYFPPLCCPFCGPPACVSAVNTGLLLNVINRWASKIDPPAPLPPANACTDAGLLLTGFASCGPPCSTFAPSVQCQQCLQYEWRLWRARTPVALAALAGINANTFNHQQPTRLPCPPPPPTCRHPPLLHSLSITLTYLPPSLPTFSTLPSALSLSIELQASLPAEVNTANRSDSLFFAFKCLSDCCPQPTGLPQGSYITSACSAASSPSQSVDACNIL